MILPYYTPAELNRLLSFISKIKCLVAIYLAIIVHWRNKDNSEPGNFIDIFSCDCYEKLQMKRWEICINYRLKILQIFTNNTKKIIRFTFILIRQLINIKRLFFHSKIKDMSNIIFYKYTNMAL